MKTLRFTKFSKLNEWDIKRLVQVSFRSHMPIVPLRDHIIEQSQKYDISNAKQQYGILGVNNQVGIFDAYQECGAKIKQKYKRMENGWIAYNPYRVNVGSIGIKRPEHTFEYISPAYVVFSCTSGLQPEFLHLLMKTPSFNRIIRDNTTGSVRQSLSFSTLKQLRIPLPTPHQQEELFSNYNQTILEAKAKEEQAYQLENEIEQYLNEELGISVSKPRLSKGLNFVHFMNARRWDLWNVSDNNFSNKYKRAELKNVILIKSGMFLPASNQIGTKYNVYGGNGITGTHNEYNCQGKRIVIGRVGEYCGNIHLVDGHYWVTDNAFIVDKILYDISWEFLEIALSNLNLNSQKSVSAQPSISQNRILQQQIPLPPIDVQNTIVAHIAEMKSKIKSLKHQASDLRKKALEDFENEIFE